MADLATLQSRLTAAELSYHTLMTGASEVEIQHGDMRTRYTGATAGQLLGYINDLKSQIVALGGAVTGERRRGFIVDL